MQFHGTSRYFYQHWPTYLGWVGGGALGALLLLVVAQLTADVGLLFLSAALLVVVAYFAGVSLWLAYQRFDAPHAAVADRLFALGQLEPEDPILHIELGDRRDALQLVRHLTTGRLTVMDVYSPQITTSGAVLRQREMAPPLQRDPRLTWQAGEFTLLPVPDHSMRAVTMHEVVRYVESKEDQLLLLQEIQRVLKPGGRFLLAIPVRTELYWLGWGPLAWGMETADHWRTLIEKAGLRVTRAEDWRGVILFLRADKLTPEVGRQLTLFNE